MTENENGGTNLPNLDEFEIPDIPNPLPMEEEVWGPLEESEPSDKFEPPDDTSPMMAEEDEDEWPEPKKIDPIYLNIPSLILGLLVNAILCLAIWRLSPSWWGIAGIFGSLFWFGYKGIKKIEIGWKGVPLILGGRLPEFLKDFLFKEGHIWTLPKPFMGCGVQDCRETPEKEFVVEELSQDRMAVKVEVAAQAKVVDPYRAFDVSDYVTSLKELTERVIRWSIVEDEAIDVPDKKRDLSIKIEREARKISVPRWGLNVIQIYVKGVRLPPELEKALAQKKIEQVQAESEETEIKNVRNLVNIMKEGTNLSYNQAANIVQSERGKIKRTVVEGNAGDFTKGAALGQKGDKE